MDKFAAACRASYMDWEASLPDIENLPEPEYSKKHKAKMDKLFDQMRENTYHRFTTKSLKIILVAAVILAMVLCAFTIPSSRKYIIEHFDGFSEFAFTQRNKNAVNYMDVGYLPEGFELAWSSDSSGSYSRCYKSKTKGDLEISKHSSATSVIFDTEDSTIEKITIGSITYLYTNTQSGMDSIVWIDTDYSYYVGGKLSKEELLKIAQNLK